jgi:hypothetical protein
VIRRTALRRAGPLAVRLRVEHPARYPHDLAQRWTERLFGEGVPGTTDEDEVVIRAVDRVPVRAGMVDPERRILLRRARVRRY